MSVLIELLWPPASLSPNARLHWRALHRAKSDYKTNCHYLLLTQSKAIPKAATGARIPLKITISPPDRRKRDRDNMQSSLKYGLDSLALFMGCDDYQFDPSYEFAEPIKGGKVVVCIGGGE